MAFDVSNLRWSIAGNEEGQSPNILSELDFKSVNSLGYFLEFRYSPIQRLEIFAYYQNNKVVSGKGTDVDYAGDNRTNPIYDLSFVSDIGRLNIIKVGVRTPFLKINATDFLAGVNYLDNSQDFYILSPDENELRSTYKTKMSGIQLGLMTDTKLTSNLSAFLSFGFTSVTYRAKADWNLRDVFKHPLSFLQTSNGIDLDGSLKLRYQINSVFSVMAVGSYFRTKVHKGTDTAFLISNVDVSTQFNGAVNTRYGAMLGINVLF